MSPGRRFAARQRGAKATAGDPVRGAALIALSFALQT